MDEQLYARVIDGQVVEVGEIPGFHEHDDGTSVSGYNFLDEEEWRKCGYVLVEDITLQPKNPKTHELATQPVYTVEADKVQMKRPIVKRAVVADENKKIARKELDQLHASVALLRGEIDEVLKIIRTAPELDLADMDARALLHSSRAQKIELLATIDILRKRVEELEKH